MRILRLLALASLFVAACGGDDGADTAATSAQPGSACIPGKTEPCACLGGTPGAQACAADGKSYGACQCGAGGAAGSNNAGTGGSSGATAGTGGSAAGTGGAGGASGKGGSATGGTGGASTAGTGGVGAGGSGGGCSPKALTEMPASVLVLLDRSGSMADGNVYAEVTSALAGPSPFSPATMVGGLRFPEGAFDDNAYANCLTPVVLGGTPTPPCKPILDDGGCNDIAKTPGAPLAVSGFTALAPLASTSMPQGSSPLRVALARAYEIVAAEPGTRRRVVALLTDGQAPTEKQQFPGPPPFEAAIACGTMPDITADAQKARTGSPSVTTFVTVGKTAAPDTPGATFTSSLAVAGGWAAPGCTPGTGECFSRNVAASLGTLGKRLRCTYAPPQGFALTWGISAGGKLLSQDPKHQNGWDLVDGAIELHGDACDAALASGASAVEPCF